MKRFITAGLFSALVCSASAQLAITIDYSYDTSGFFTGANAGRQAHLNTAANYLSSFISGTSLSAITPGGGNTWTASTFDPSDTNNSITLVDAVVPANRIIVYAGGSPESTGFLAFGATPSVSATGTSSFVNNVTNRGTTVRGGVPSIGSITFDSTDDWYFDNDLSTLENFGNNYDFFTVAVHELMHAIGFGTSNAWSANRLFNFDFATSTATYAFRGANARAVYGGNVPLSETGDHWASTVLSTLADGTVQTPIMNAAIGPNTRRYITALDAAALRDLGFSPIPEPSSFALIAGVFSLGVVASRRRRPHQRPGDACNVA